MNIELKEKIVGTNPEWHQTAIFINGVEFPAAKVSNRFEKENDYYNLVSTNMMDEIDGQGHYYILKNGKFFKEICTADSQNWKRYL